MIMPYVKILSSVISEFYGRCACQCTNTSDVICALLGNLNYGIVHLVRNQIMELIKILGANLRIMSITLYKDYMRKIKSLRIIVSIR
jgi:hypothetical protein